MPPFDTATPCSILVVDRLPELEATALTLQQAGYEVHQAATVLDALQRAKDDRPGLILLRIGLPDLAAGDLVRQIRADPAISSLSVLLLGADKSDPGQEIDTEAAADGYIVPPVTATTLLERVRSHFRPLELADQLRASEQPLSPYQIARLQDAAERRKHEIAKKRTHSEEKASRALQRLTEAQRIGRIGDWEWDLDSQRIYWSPQVFEILGRHPELGPPKDAEEHASLYDEASVALMSEKIDEAIASGVVQEYGLTALRPDGQEVMVLARAVPRKDEHGRVTGLYGTIQDVTERKRAERELKESEERFRTLLQDVSTVAVQGYAMDGTTRYWNRASETFYGYTAEEAIGANLLDLIIPPEIRDGVTRAVERMAKTGEPIPSAELSLARKDGSRVTVFSSHTTVRVPGREPELFCVDIDLTEHKRTEEALRASEASFRTLVESMPQIVWVSRPDGWHIDFNQHWLDYTGLTLEESLGRGWNPPLHPDDRERAARLWQEATENGQPYEIEYRLRSADGVYHWMLGRALPLRDQEGRIVKWFGTCTDIHELKTAEENLRRNEALMRIAGRTAKLGAWAVDIREKQVTWSDGVCALLDLPAGTQPTLEQWLDYYAPQSRPLISEALAACEHHGSAFNLVLEVLSAKDRKLWVRCTGEARLNTKGEITGVHGAFQDITEHKRALEALKASEKRFRALFDQAAVGVVLTEVADGRFVQANRRFCEITGYSHHEITRLTFAAITHPSDEKDSLEAMRRIVAGEAREYSLEKRYLHKNGDEIWINITVSAMWGVDEPPDFVIAVVQDITQRKNLEEQFRQAQKMEAIGTLAGGIAHDFNNILGAIYGYTGLAQLKLKDNPETRELLDSIMQASNRAADLVQQILTFSRQQPQERRVIELRPVVAEATKLLRSTLPSTISFDTSFSSDAPAVFADATQIHQVLMNLGTNAWHAMKDGSGQLRVMLARHEVQEAEANGQSQLRPGLYARLTISDTGCGMDAATLQRIYEPFFTTKKPGEGTGLGLAVVHGVMDTHDGVVTVHSEPGAGTTFDLYFPAHAGEATSAFVEKSLLSKGQGERILFVDDEEAIAQVGKQVLEILGYEVEVATDPRTALERVRAESRRFALVITDQTMPGMTGLDLSLEIRKARADLPIILMTGYGLSLTPERASEVGCHQILLKPFDIHTLQTAVLRALAGSPHS